MELRVCPKCNAEGQASAECLRCGIVFKKFQEAEDMRKIISLQKFQSVDLDAEGVDSIDGPFDRFSQNPWVKIFFLPACFLLALGAGSITLVKILTFGFTHWFHEIGHSLFAWLSGRASLPILGVAITSYEKSVFTYFCFLFLIFILGYSGHRFKSPYLIFVAVLLFLSQSFYTFFASDSFWEMSMIYGGMGGEFILAGLVIGAFAHRLPQQTYWSLLRFIVVPWSIMSFWQSSSMWIKIYRSEEMIPWGSLWGGGEDSNGDMNRLHLNYDFSREDLIHVYMVTMAICLTFILATYVWLLWSAVGEVIKNRNRKSL